MDTSGSESTAPGFYVPDKLYEDDQITLYADFRMEIQEDQDEPESRPTYIQEIVSGKRRLISMGRPRFASFSATPLTPVQRLSARRKSTSTHRVVAHRRRKREKLKALDEQLRSEMIAAIPTRYSFVFLSIAEGI